MAKSKVNVNEIISEQLINALQEAIKNGKDIPWHCPWNVIAPMNVITKKPYTGINPFLLNIRGYDSPFWMSFKQASELAYAQWRKRHKKGKDTPEVHKEWMNAEDRGGIKEGEKSTIITWRKKLVIDDPDHPQADEEGKRAIFMLRYYRVFNAEQTEGIEFPEVEKPEGSVKPIESAEALLKGYVNTDRGPKFSNGGNQAAYNYVKDSIRIPAMKRFDNDVAYYSTAFHEAIHSTGHDSRLKRGDFGKGVKPYSREELVAEFGAAMLCANAGIDIVPDIENRTAYIKGWLKALGNDEKLAVKAASAAQKAADLIIGEDDNNPYADDGIVATPED